MGMPADPHTQTQTDRQHSLVLLDGSGGTTNGKQSPPTSKGKVIRLRAISTGHDSGY